MKQGEFIMEQNFFTFAGDCSTEYTFLCWCLLWYNDKSEPKNPLFYMAKDILAFMGEDELTDSQKIDVCQWKDDGIDILVNLRGLNRVLVIDHRIGSMQYEDEVTDYRKCLLRSKKVLGIDESVKIRTVLFHTYYCSDFYHDVMADCKINKESLLFVLEKYEDANRSLDIYIDSLRERIALDTLEERDWQYKKAMNYENYLNDNLSHSRIAQYNFMRDIFRSYYPESMWKQNSDTFKIQQGDDLGGESPWTEFPFIEGINSDSKINYYLCWRLETYDNNPYMSLRLFESSEQKAMIHYGKADKLLKQLAEKFLLRHPELKRIVLQKSKNDVPETDIDIFGHHISTILSVSLKEPLKNWQNEADYLRHSLVSITDYFLKEISTVMQTNILLNEGEV